MSAVTSRFSSASHPDARASNVGTRRLLSDEPDTMARQLDLATEAALAAIPPSGQRTRLSAAWALDASIERHLRDLGLTDLADRYRSCRRRRALAVSSAARPPG